MYCICIRICTYSYTIDHYNTEEVQTVLREFAMEFRMEVFEKLSQPGGYRTRAQVHIAGAVANERNIQNCPLHPDSHQYRYR